MQFKFGKKVTQEIVLGSCQCSNKEVFILKGFPDNKVIIFFIKVHKIVFVYYGI